MYLPPIKLHVHTIQTKFPSKSKSAVIYKGGENMSTKMTGKPLQIFSL